MAEDRLEGGDSGRDDDPVASFDTRTPHPARVYDYWLGGKDNFAADREAAEKVIAVNPTVLAGVRANRAFLARAVRYLAGEAGIRQFLDLGTGLPTAENTHQVAQAIAPEARIVYVDNDPIVLSHARALLASGPEGVTAYVQADIRDTGKVLAAAAETLDFGLPVAVMALMILQYIPDADDPWAITRQVLEPLAPGSYLTVSDTTGDIDAARVTEGTARLNERMPTRLNLRSRPEFERFFAAWRWWSPVSSRCPNGGQSGRFTRSPAMPGWAASQPSAERPARAGRGVAFARPGLACGRAGWNGGPWAFP